MTLSPVAVSHRKTMSSAVLVSATRMCEGLSLTSSKANSSLPVVKNALASERVAADNHTDRMTIWMRNVESER